MHVHRRLWPSRRVGRLVIGGLLTAAAVATAVVPLRLTWACDHEDAPSLVSDPGTDIADVFAFMRPGSTTHLALVMTVHPNANATTRFDDGVEYAFHVSAYDPSSSTLQPTPSFQVACRFEPPGDGGQQVFVCTANGFSTFGTVGGTPAAGPSDPLRVFAGLRADPAFGDVAALKDTLASGQSKFKDGGTNAFAGKNVLAIVVELDVDKIVLSDIDASTGRPHLAVSATTERL